MKFLKVILSNLLVITVIVVILITGVALVLKRITRHGESLTVPDITGMQLGDAEKLLTDRKLRYIITDSLFFEDKAPSSILEQNPEPQAKVKEGRIIYLTINSNTAPLVSVPDLTDVTLRQANVMLQSVGLKTGELVYKPDIAQNVVLDQLYGGRSVKPPSRIPKGSIVDLVVGNGLGDSASVAIPNLTGLTRQDAYNLLVSSSLNLGAVIYQGSITDSASAVVFRQNPAFAEGYTLKAGQSVDIYLNQE
jgi:beta-lactam-binding protein with PASTA domain